MRIKREKLGFSDIFVSQFVNVKVQEAVAQRCSVKKVFLKISQNLQENNCTGV